MEITYGEYLMKAMKILLFSDCSSASLSLGRKMRQRMKLKNPSA